MIQATRDPLSDENERNRRRCTGAEQRRSERKVHLVGRRDHQLEDWTHGYRRRLRYQPGIGRGLTGPGAERIVWSSLVRTMVRMTVGGIDVT
jgi:hypothetical protein